MTLAEINKEIQRPEFALEVLYQQKSDLLIAQEVYRIPQVKAVNPRLKCVGSFIDTKTKG